MSYLDTEFCISKESFGFYDNISAYIRIQNMQFSFPLVSSLPMCGHQWLALFFVRQSALWFLSELNKLHQEETGGIIPKEFQKFLSHLYLLSDRESTVHQFHLTAE